MQVGDYQCALGRPVKRAGLMRKEGLAADRDMLIGEVVEPDAFWLQDAQA
jgi:hypothetical protein